MKNYPEDGVTDVPETTPTPDGNESRSPTLSEAISSVLLAGLPGNQRPPRRAVDLVLTAGMTAQKSAIAAPIMRAATAWCLMHSGHYSEALKVAQLTTPPNQLNPDLPAEIQSASHAALAEVFLLSGRLPAGVAAARNAAEYAPNLPAHRFRAINLLAVGHALNGEREAAFEWLEAAEKLDPAGVSQTRSWPATLAALQLRALDLDVSAVSKVLAAFEPEPDFVTDTALFQLGSTWLAMLKSDFRRAIALAEPLTHGVDAGRYPPLFAAQAVSAQALAMIHLGDPAAATIRLAKKKSLPGHIICYESHLAGLHLLLGEPRRALSATTVCIHDTPDHSLATLPSVYLHRAVAHDLLGEGHLADSAFSRAAHLAAESTGIRPAIGLPLDVLKRLYWRLIDNEPKFAPVLLAALPPAGTYPDRRELNFRPVELTERERVLADWIITDLTMAAIAKELCVSVNTIKTQAKSLFRKLNVSSRQQARHRLGLTGMINDPRGRQ